MAIDYVMGLDIGGTNIRVGLVDKTFQLSHFVRWSTKEFTQKDIIPSLIKKLEIYIGQTGLREHIKAIAAGVPGQVGKDHSYVYSVPKVQGLENIDLGRVFSDSLGIPVYAYHDVDLLMYHDIKAMGLDPEHTKTIIGCYLGTGFGNALYINGSLYTGKHGVAAELGHTPFYGVKDICNCGAIGCVETRCSGAYLADMVKTQFPGCFIGDIFTNYASDPRIVRFIEDCALPIATEITLIDPDYVLLGGGVITMKDFPIHKLEEEVIKRSRHPLPAADIHFVYATDSQTTGVLGGGMAVYDLLEKSKVN